MHNDFQPSSAFLSLNNRIHSIDSSFQYGIRMLDPLFGIGQESGRTEVPKIYHFDCVGKHSNMSRRQARSRNNIIAAGTSISFSVLSSNPQGG